MPNPIKLRRWQSEALETYFEANKKDFLAVVTPGGGKTKWALMVAIQLAKMERLIVVCPTVHIKEQWIEEAGSFGLHLSDLEECASNHLVTTYAQVANRPDDFA